MEGELILRTGHVFYLNLFLRNRDNVRASIEQGWL